MAFNALKSLIKNRILTIGGGPMLFTGDKKGRHRASGGAYGPVLVGVSMAKMGGNDRYYYPKNYKNNYLERKIICQTKHKVLTILMDRR